MAGNRSAKDLARTELASDVTLIGALLADNEGSASDEPGTIPEGSASDGNTLVSNIGMSGQGSVTKTQASSVEPKVIGKYQLRRVLGVGGMGVVYLAFDPMIEREVALKVLSPEIAQTPAALQRFLCEARSIGRLNHPHVVSIYEIGEWNGIYFLVMELLTGGSVADLAERTGPLPWREACRIVAQSARGLAAAHAAGMIHRDVKPANLMLNHCGDVKVVDFGLSKLQDSESKTVEAVTRAGQLLGTPHYMSPEQFDGVAVDTRTDIYALGATFFRLLTDRFPYQDCSSIIQLMKAHLTRPVPGASQFVRSVPAECDQIVARAMAKEPSERYANCSDLAAEIEALLTAQGSEQTNFAVSEESEPAVSTLQRSIDRPLSKAIIVESSRMQAAIRKDVLTQAGAKSVEICGSIAEACVLMESGLPDLVWTSMELPDGRAVDWLRAAAAVGELRYATVVLNCSDCTVAELAEVGNAASLIIAPKAARMDAILQVVHGAGPVRLTQKASTGFPEASGTSIRVISDTGLIPDSLADLLSKMHLDDLEILSFKRAPAQRVRTPVLTLLIRTAETLRGDENAYAAMVSVRRPELAASIQSVGGSLYLRSVGHAGVVSLLKRSLDTTSLNSLLQAGHAIQLQAVQNIQSGGPNRRLLEQSWNRSPE